MVKKKIVLFNLWIDNNNGYFDGITLSIIFVCIIMINILNTSLIFIPMGLIAILSLIGIYRSKHWTSNNIDLRDYFPIPEVGDILVVMDDEKFNFYLHCYTSSLFVGYEKGDEIRIEEVNVNDGNIKLGCKCVNHVYNIDWYKTKKFVKTKSDIRADKLKELGI